MSTINPPRYLQEPFRMLPEVQNSRILLKNHDFQWKYKDFQSPGPPAARFPLDRAAEIVPPLPISSPKTWTPPTNPHKNVDTPVLYLYEHN